MLKDVDTLDFELLKAISNLASGLEVKAVSWHDWELAILEGYKLFRILNRNRGGRVKVDLQERRLEYFPIGTRRGSLRRSRR